MAFATPRRAAVCLGLLIVGGLVLGGCRPQEQISHYRVPSEEELLKENGPAESEAATPEHRMLAAMIPRGDDQAWFFRLSGPLDAVDKEADKFRELIKTVHFADDGKPAWELPAGWRNRAGEGLRFATIEIDGAAAPLDFSVMSLPRNDPDLDLYTLANLNRWRGQLGLRPLAPRQLASNIERISLGDGEATLFDMRGHKPDGMAQGPFARGMMSQKGAPDLLDHAGKTPAPGPARGAAAGESAELTYDVPTGWEPGAADGLRKAAFKIGGGDEAAEVTVISLSGAGGSTLDNVNRWRQQIGLDGMNEDELKSAARAIEMGPLTGEMVELVSADEKRAILGVIVKEREQAWFFKMSGAAAVVLREKPNFESFVQSVRFAQPGR